MDTRKTVNVAAGVVVDPDGRILVARRPDHKHQGGLWEFPGGKIEGGESVQQALDRELREEVGIEVAASEPLIRIHHDYADKSVCLQVLKVTQFRGTAAGLEGQQIAWVAPDELLKLAFPAANTPIVAAARLPRTIMITGPFDTERELLRRLQKGLEKSPGMVQFRAPWLSEQDYVRLARGAHAVCRSLGIPLIANCALDSFQAIGCEGLHLKAKALHSVAARPVPATVWLSAACHSAEDLRQAAGVGVDYGFLSPVQATQSHPDQTPIGWSGFAALVDSATLPVYALGGLAIHQLPTAIQQGGQGVAAIGAFWSEWD